MQKHLLVIHAHGLAFPNAGSLSIALSHYFERLSKTKRVQHPLPLISIAVDIAYHSPRTFPISSAIISKLLSHLDRDDARRKTIKKIQSKLSQLPNTGLMDIWLQRISHSFMPDIEFKEPLCTLVKGTSVPLWNSDWISSAKLKKALDPNSIVNRKRLRATRSVIVPAEIRIFAYEGY